MRPHLSRTARRALRQETSSDRLAHQRVAGALGMTAAAAMPPLELLGQAFTIVGETLNGGLHVIWSELNGQAARC